MVLAHHVADAPDGAGREHHVDVLLQCPSLLLKVDRAAALAKLPGNMGRECVLRVGDEGLWPGGADHVKASMGGVPAIQQDRESHGRAAVDAHVAVGQDLPALKLREPGEAVAGIEDLRGHNVAVGVMGAQPGVLDLGELPDIRIIGLDTQVNHVGDARVDDFPELGNPDPDVIVQVPTHGQVGRDPVQVGAHATCPCPCAGAQ